MDEMLVAVVVVVVVIMVTMKTRVSGSVSDLTRRTSARARFWCGSILPVSKRGVGLISRMVRAITHNNAPWRGDFLDGPLEMRNKRLWGTA